MNIPRVPGLSHGERETFRILIGLLLMLVLFPTLHIGFTTIDDVQTALIAMDPSPGQPVARAIAEGRVTQAINTYIDWVPYLIDHPAWFHTLRLLPILLSVVLFYVLVQHLAGATLALITTVVATGLLQTNWHHSLITAYPFVFVSGFVALELALIGFIRRFNDMTPSVAIAVGLLYLYSLITYELFVLYLPLFWLIPWMVGQDQQGDGVNRGRIPGLLWHPGALLAVHIPVLLFIVVYFSFQWLYPPSYDGISVSWSLTGFARTLTQFLIGTLPGIFYLLDWDTMTSAFDGPGPHYVGLIPFWESVQGAWLAKGLVVAGATVFVLRRGVDASPHQLRATALAGAFMWVSPFALHSLTIQYQQWSSHGNIAYIPTYFAHFGLMALLGATMVALDRRVARGSAVLHVYRGCLFAILFTLSLVIDYANHFTFRDQALAGVRWKSMASFIRSRPFLELPGDAIILAPTLWTHHRGILDPGELNGYWDSYIRRRSGRPVRIIRSPEEIPASSAQPLYYLRFNQATKDSHYYLILSSIDDAQSPVARQFTLYSSSPYQRFTVFGEFSQPTTSPGDGSGDSNARTRTTSMATRFFRETVSPGEQPKSNVMGNGKDRSFLELIRLGIDTVFRRPPDSEGEWGVNIVELSSPTPVVLESLSVSYFEPP